MRQVVAAAGWLLLAGNMLLVPRRPPANLQLSNSYKWGKDNHIIAATEQ
jgi:hypothetical protein